MVRDDDAVMSVLVQSMGVSMTCTRTTLRGLALAFTIAASAFSSTQPTDAILSVCMHPLHVLKTARFAATVICNRQWPRRTAADGAYVGRIHERLGIPLAWLSVSLIGSSRDVSTVSEASSLRSIHVLVSPRLFRCTCSCKSSHLWRTTYTAYSILDLHSHWPQLGQVDHHGGEKASGALWRRRHCFRPTAYSAQGWRERFEAFGGRPS